jgi:hypothetical protein
VSRTFPRQLPPAISARPLGSAPVGGDDGCLEATLVVRPGEQPHVRLAQLAWGVGVGWYAQQSLDLKLDEVQELARMLTDVATRVEAEPEGPAPVSLAEFRARRAQKDRP